MKRFADLTYTAPVVAAQQRNGSRDLAGRQQLRAPPEGLGDREWTFILACESCFMASTGPEGWPYVQHRGGRPGFLQSVGEDTLAMPDYRGNRQYVSVGNLDHDPRVSLILVDYAARRRLKLMGFAERIEAADAEPALVQRFAGLAGEVPVERYLVIRVEAFDWNCPQHIPVLYSVADVANRIEPFARHIAHLESLLRGAGIEPPGAPTLAD